MTTPASGRSSESDWRVIRSYWEIYGGFKGLFTSPYFCTAILISIVGYPVWMNKDWWELPLSILPNMLGFSLAGYAIFLAFGNDGFRSFLSKAKIGSSSAYVSLTTTFMHFVVLQVISLLLALTAKFLSLTMVSLPPCFAMALLVAQKSWWFLCFTLFLYSLTTSLASVVAIFRIVRMFDLFVRSVEAGKPRAAGDEQSD